MTKSDPNANGTERSEIEQINLAFLDQKDFENGQCIRGAILVTNSKTDPLEFRCTSPIRPTALQKTLWGSRLSGYIASHLIGMPLLDSVSNKSSLVVVRDASLLELRPLIKLPVVQLTALEKTGKALRGAKSEGDNDIIQSSDGAFEAIVMKFHPAHCDDIVIVRELLHKVSRSFGLLEPFQRIDTALGLVQQQG